MADNATVKSDVTRVAFEKALDGVGRADLESRYRKAIFEVEQATLTLTIAQEVGTRLHNENVALKNCLRAVKILLENDDVKHALECLVSALSE